MTELTITPKTADKTARFRGTVAAGEHVAVTIKGGAAWLGDDNGEHLSLRVLDLVTGRTLAVFPRPPETYEDGDEPEEQDEWDTAGEDDADLFCNLNLNTDRMVNAARHMLRVPVLFVLGEKDDEDASVVRTLYFRDRYEVEFWPERVGDDTPYDLDRWPKQIDEWTQLVADWNARLGRMKLAAQRSTDEPPPADVPYTTITLNSGVDGETDTVVKVYDGENGKDGKDGQDGQTTHAWVEEHFLALAGGTMAGGIVFSVSGGQQSITAGSGGVVVTDGAQGYEFTRSGNVAGPGTVARLSDVATRYEKPQGGIPKTDLASAVQTSLGKADTALQAHQSLDAYVNGGNYDSTSKKILLKHGSTTIAEIDAKDFIKDGMVDSVEITGGNLVISFNTDAGVEDIEIPLTDIFNPANYYDKTAADGRFVQKEAGKGLFSGAYGDLTDKPTLEDAIVRTSSNAVKSSGIWSMIWGALMSVPSGVSSLYDWCKSFFANASAIAPTWDASGTYQVGDVCVESEIPDSSGFLYRCKKAYTATSESDAPSHDTEHWDRIDVLSLLAGKQSRITASGILKGDGSGGVTAAVAGTDYQAPLTIDAMPTASSTNPVQSGGVKTALDDKLSIAGDTRSVTAEDSGGTETYAFVGTGEVGNANAVARIKELPYVNVGEAEEMLVGVYAISSRGVQRHTATSGETSATFGFADTPGTGKIADAVLDIDNSGNTSALGMEFSGLGTTFMLVPPDGDDLAEMTSVDGGKQARFYFTETALVSNGLPVISIQRITLGAVATAITRGS